MLWMKNLWKRLIQIFRRKGNPFELTAYVKSQVSPMELHIYKMDADRNGKSLSEWVRSTLNGGVSKSTMLHLSKGSDSLQNSLDAVYNMMDAEDRNYDGAPIIPLLRNEVRMPTNISGHPCRHLDPTIPKNFTASECQGICTNPMPGMNGRPCFWGAQAARQCNGFDTKRVLPLSNSSKINGKRGT